MSHRTATPTAPAYAIARATRDAVLAARAANRHAAEAVRRHRAGDFVGELGARAVAAFYRHELRRHLGIAQRARFLRTVAWVVGEDLERAPA